MRLGFLPTLALASLLGCVAEEAGNGDSSDSDDDDASSSETGEPSCDAGDDCQACLAMSGCNWTGESCEPMCLQDASCYGPGNPSAPACPDPGTTGGECVELGDDCLDAQCCDGLECQGELVPVCVDPGQCLPDGAQCNEASECCDGRECTGEEVLLCTVVDCAPSGGDCIDAPCCDGLVCDGESSTCLDPGVCAGEGDSCADAPCCDVGELYCDPDLQLCVLPPG